MYVSEFESVYSYTITIDNTGQQNLTFILAHEWD